MFSNLSVRTFRWSVNLHKKGDAAKNLELPKKSVKSKKSTETPEKSKKIVGAKKDQTDKREPDTTEPKLSIEQCATLLSKRSHNVIHKKHQF